MASSKLFSCIGQTPCSTRLIKRQLVGSSAANLTNTKCSRHLYAMDRKGGNLSSNFVKREVSWG